ncbi:MAG TPA: TonB-dependent receptor, partial [Opitutaceae bacterium]
AILQGGRGRIDLADVAGQVQVFTKEFMDDLGALNADEAFLFSATTQTYYDNVNGTGDTRPGSRNIADDSGNSRGLGNVDKTRNYFRTSIDSDAYNTERLTLVSGANAVQFGLGGAAGTAETTTVRSNLTRNRQKVQYRIDSHGSERFVLDYNQVIAPQKLALRAIFLRENKEYFLQPGFDDSQRVFLTSTIQPFKGTTLRIEGEYMGRRDGRPSTVLARDMGYLDFVRRQQAGNPLVYVNRAATAATAGRPPAPTFSLSDGTTRAYAFSNKTALFIWPQNGVPNFTSIQDVRNTVVVNVGDGAGTAGQTQTLLDPGLPWDVNVAGFSRYNLRRTRNITATLEQRLARNTFLELGFSHEFYRNQTAQLFANNAYDVLVDVNRYLPDGATPNPMYGRPFIESNNQAGQGQWSDNFLTQYRAVVAHELDFTRNQNWSRHLGRHRLGFFASYDDSAAYTLAQLRNLIIGRPSFLSAAARDNPLHAERAFHMRFYLPPLGSVGDSGLYGIPSPDAYGDLMGTMTFTTPAGEPFQVTAYENPVGGVGTAPSANHLQRGSLAASTSSSFFRNHFVANVGVRYDRVRNSDFAAFIPILAATPITPQQPLGTGFRAYSDFRREVPPDVWTPYRTATRANYGVILRPPYLENRVSFGYDFSRNASLNEVAVVRSLGGDEVEAAYGESREYSVRFRLFNDRLNLKVNYFNSLQRNFTLPDSGLRQNFIDFEQQLLANDPTFAINPHVREELAPVPANFRLPGDRNSKGIEIEATFNPTPGWRLFMNVGRTDTEIDDLSTRATWDYLDARVAVWRAYKGNWSTASYDASRTVEAAYNSLIVGPRDDIAASLGNPGNNSQTWRSNLVATRSFTQGWLRGATASMNLRYRGPAIVGFATRIDEKGRVRQDWDKQYKSDGYVLTGLMGSYRFRGAGGTAWRVQLNANNVFNTKRVFLTRTFADGSPRNYGRQAGREFILAMDLEH